MGTQRSFMPGRRRPPPDAPVTVATPPPQRDTSHAKWCFGLIPERLQLFSSSIIQPAKSGRTEDMHPSSWGQRSVRGEPRRCLEPAARVGGESHPEPPEGRIPAPCVYPRPLS